MGRMPSWWKGKKIYDFVDGAEYHEFDPRIRKQEGHYVHRDNFDTLTDAERKRLIKR
jgi:hypothetical protein